MFANRELEKGREKVHCTQFEMLWAEVLFDLGNVPIVAEILKVLNMGSEEDSLDFLGFLSLPPTTSRL